MSPQVTTREDWQPGEPLYTGRGNHTRALFEIRNDPTGGVDGEDCLCKDRATWPEPVHYHNLIYSEALWEIEDDEGQHTTRGSHEEVRSSNSSGPPTTDL